MTSGTCARRTEGAGAGSADSAGLRLAVAGRRGAASGGQWRRSSCSAARGGGLVIGKHHAWPGVRRPLTPLPVPLTPDGGARKRDVRAHNGQLLATTALLISLFLRFAVVSFHQGLHHARRAADYRPLCSVTGASTQQAPPEVLMARPTAGCVIRRGSSPSRRSHQSVRQMRAVETSDWLAPLRPRSAAGTAFPAGPPTSRLHRLSANPQHVTCSSA